jgi:TPR repeat protein
LLKKNRGLAAVFSFLEETKMKVRIVVLSLAMMLGIPAMADDLAEANRLLESKAYPQALAMYTKLANAGNAKAQFNLGEMYWYGEAGSIDLVQARNWFTKSAAAGNKEASAALETMALRETRRKDIDYWISGYDGKDMKSGAYDCRRPEIPVISRSNDEIKTVDKTYAVWQSCYNDFVQNLGDALPAGKRIPQDIARLMNQIEYDQAVANLDRIYRGLAQQGSDSATAIIGEYEKWRKATEQFVTARNAEAKLEAELAVEQLRRANLNQTRSAKHISKGSIK